MSAPAIVDTPVQPAPVKSNRARRRSSLLAHGEPSVWLSGGALALALVMIFSLLLLILVQGTATFWPGKLVQIHTLDGKVYLGEVTRDGTYTPTHDEFMALPADKREEANASIKANGD